MSEDTLKRGKRRTWKRHKEYLHQNTPLSEKEASVLALSRLGVNPEKMATVLGIKKNTVNRHWSKVQDKFKSANEIMGLVGDEFMDLPPLNSFDAERPWWAWPWELRAHAIYEKDSGEKISLMLYVDMTASPDYLLIEHETTSEKSWMSEEKVTRTMHGANGIRDYIYTSGEEDQFAWAVRWVLLEHAGIDPGAECTPNPEKYVGDGWRTVLDQYYSEAKDTLVELEN